MITIGVDEQPLAVALEGTVTRVVCHGIRIGRCFLAHDEVAFALNVKVHVLTGRFHVATARHRINGTGLHPKSDLLAVDTAKAQSGR